VNYHERPHSVLSRRRRGRSVQGLSPWRLEPPLRPSPTTSPRKPRRDPGFASPSHPSPLIIMTSILARDILGSSILTNETAVRLEAIVGPRLTVGARSLRSSDEQGRTRGAIDVHRAPSALDFKSFSLEMVVETKRAAPLHVPFRRRGPPRLPPVEVSSPTSPCPLHCAEGL